MLDGAIQIGRRIIGVVATKWQDWRSRRQQMRELALCDEQMAREFGFTPNELGLLARRGSKATHLLQRRLRVLGIDSKTISATQPDTTWDLQRSCSVCSVKRRCARDLNASNDSRWQNYCLNAQTLAILESLKIRK